MISEIETPVMQVNPGPMCIIMCSIFPVTQNSMIFQRCQAFCPAWGICTVLPAHILCDTEYGAHQSYRERKENFFITAQILRGILLPAKVPCFVGPKGELQRCNRGNLHS
jgi:hypothetical protein